MTIIRDATIRAQKYLENDDILLFIGARQAGKTTILKQLQSHIELYNRPTHFITLEDPDYLPLLNKSPKNLFKIFSFDERQKTVVFIDEIQYLSRPSNFLKFLHDEYKNRIKLIVSGSSAFYIDRKFTDSLSGRKRIFYVHTLSFREFVRAKGEDALSAKNYADLSLTEQERAGFLYREYIIFGGYPRVVLSPVEEKSEILRDIAYSYVKKDIYDAGVRQEELFYKLLKIFAAQTGSLVNASELASTLGVSKTSIDNYLYVMRKSFHISLIPPFHTNIRKELVKMPKVYFYDLGLCNFFTNNFSQFELRKDRGTLLGNAVFRALEEKYGADAIRFWRTADQCEIDFIVNEGLAYEVKADPGKFSKRNFSVFSKIYPNIPFSIVSFDAGKSVVDGHRVVDVREI